MAPRQARDATDDASVGDAPTGREAQRRRTRRAIVDAARSLVLAGDHNPTLDAIAAAAEVSRRTIYMHFATLDQLLLDATLGALSDAYVDTALAGSASGVGADHHGLDVHARLDALIDSVLGLAPSTLPLGRRIMALTVAAPPEPGTPPARAGAARRGERRTAWLEAVIEPVRSRLSDEQADRLISGLSMVIGFEAMVVLRDIRDLDPVAEARTIKWAAHALADSVLREAEHQR